jgi:2'-5' RNA ligase
VLLDAPVRAALAARVEALRPLASGVAWVVADNLHVTVKFLGGVERPRLELIDAALARAVAGVSRFDLAIAGLGAFPTPARARVIWAGIGGERDALGALAARAERELTSIGFSPEDRLFAPHVTLGRVREPRRNERLADALGRASSETFGRVRIDRLSLMRSDLSPHGSRYTELSAHALG